MAKQKTIFQQPLFWGAVGGLGLAYYMYKNKKKSNTAVTTGTNTGTQATTVNNNSTTNSPGALPLPLIERQVLPNYSITTPDGEILI